MERPSEDHMDEEKGSAIKDPLLGTIATSSSSKGGLRTLPFILGNEAHYCSCYILMPLSLSLFEFLLSHILGFIAEECYIF